MKKLFYLLSLSLLFVSLGSCEKDECVQDALCSATSTATFAKTGNAYPDEFICKEEDDIVKYLICHNEDTLCVEESGVQYHLDHGDTLGECETLSTGGLVFRDGEVVSIPCKYKLPFIHVADNGQQWIYTIPH